jgi:predicted PurR-regulated permease PerM
MITKNNNLFLSISIGILTLGFIIYVLFIGASIIIPFIVAILLSFLLLSISNSYHHIGIPKYISFIGSIITVVIVFYIIGLIINNNIEEIIKAAPEYQEKLENILSLYIEKYNIDSTVIRNEIIQKIDIAYLVSWTAAIVTSIVKNAGIIFFFMVFILLESKSFKAKLALIT